ncbi:hypothetical protein EYF80_033667 [Liparis tanakae]|uniref:Uncharacterized protein n=1 Tax=Liparis tanakae TaxID=230148 RepID=A0A4Z2GRB5_9TELE|nr:hypothetical protein EYF80_033667 [Liparis tanakae]
MHLTGASALVCRHQTPDGQSVQLLWTAGVNNLERPHSPLVQTESRRSPPLIPIAGVPNDSLLCVNGIR